MIDWLIDWLIVGLLDPLIGPLIDWILHLFCMDQSIHSTSFCLSFHFHSFCLIFIGAGRLENYPRLIGVCPRRRAAIQHTGRRPATHGWHRAAFGAVWLRGRGQLLPPVLCPRARHPAAVPLGQTTHPATVPAGGLFHDRQHQSGLSNHGILPSLFSLLLLAPNHTVTWKKGKIVSPYFPSMSCFSF